MPFVPSGRKGRKKRERDAEERNDSIIDNAVSRVRHVIQGAGLCLPTCVLLQRILTLMVPARPFVLRLGSLHVLPADARHAELGPILFDPRHPDGIDAGFHAWLEDRAGKLLDATIPVTLHANAYSVDRETYILDGGRRLSWEGLVLHYEELPELELRGLVEAEEQLASLIEYAMAGVPRAVGMVPLDVRWRS